MLKTLTKSPDKIFEFDNDEEAKQLLFELGLLGKFSQNPPQPSTTHCVTYANNPTHWIMAMLFLGKTNPEDNGYLVFCLPKNRVKPEQARDFAIAKMAQFGLPIVIKPFSENFTEN